MGKIKDLSNQTFGMWSVEGFAGKDDRNKALWNCICTCGTSRIVASRTLTSGDSNSCGCKRADDVSKRFTTHGLSKTKLHEKWRGMMSRCYNPDNNSFKYYGGRGISVSDAWHDFPTFYADNFEFETSGLTLDRINNELGYSKENCRWTDVTTQNNNRRFNVVVTHDGKTLTLAQWALKLGINYHTLYSRYVDEKWSFEKSIYIGDARKLPKDYQVIKRSDRWIEYMGETKTLSQWADSNGIDRGTLSSRLKVGWSMSDAITPGTRKRKAKSLTAMGDTA